MTSPLTPSAWPTREDVARQIEPDYWHRLDNGEMAVTTFGIQHSLDRADAILALFPPPLSAREAEEAGALLPCPFCGCAMHLHYDRELEYFGPEGDHARGCLIGSISFVDYADRDHAIREWNARVSSQTPTSACERSEQGNLPPDEPSPPPAQTEAESLGGWLPIESAPRDGTPILAFCIHANHQYARTPEEKAQWTEIVVTRWIDHNGGGWTWNGLCGVHTHWMPLPKAPETDAHG